MKRTPKNYDGISSPIKTIQQLLQGFLQKKSGDLLGEFVAVWPEMVGSKMAPLTKVFSFSDGVLTIIVKSSTLYQLLCQHEKPRLLAQLKERFGERVRNIVFRIG